MKNWSKVIVFGVMFMPLIVFGGATSIMDSEMYKAGAAMVKSKDPISRVKSPDRTSKQSTKVSMPKSKFKTGPSKGFERSIGTHIKVLKRTGNVRHQRELKRALDKHIDLLLEHLAHPVKAYGDNV